MGIEPTDLQRTLFETGPEVPAGKASKLAAYTDNALQVLRSENGGGINYGAARDWASNRYRAVSTYLKEHVADPIAVEAKIMKNAYANAGQRTKAALATAVALGILAAYSPAITVGQTVPDTAPGAGQTQPPADEQQPEQPSLRSQTVQEEGTIFPCAKTGETWNLDNLAKYNFLFPDKERIKIDKRAQERRDRLLRYSRFAETYVEGVRTGKNSVTCNDYDLKLLGVGLKKPLVLRAVGTEGREILLSIFENIYRRFPSDKNNPQGYDQWELHILTDGNNAKIPITLDRANLILAKKEPPVSGIDIKGVNVGIDRKKVQFDADVRLDPRIRFFDMYLAFYLFELGEKPIHGGRCFTPLCEKYGMKETLANEIAEIAMAAETGKYYERYKKEFIERKPGKL